MGSGGLFVASLRLWCGSAFCPYAVEQDAGGFVGGVLCYQFTLEGLGEHGLIEIADQFAGAYRVSGKAVYPCESRFDAPGDLGLLGKRCNRKHSSAYELHMAGVAFIQQIHSE